jgi:hypothetical protein
MRPMIRLPPACSNAAALALACCLACGPAAQAAAPSASRQPAPAQHHYPQPSKEALALAAQVRARWMGVDRAGNLWAWEPLEGSVRFFSPAAGRLLTVNLPLTSVAVDGDVEWGAAALTDDGNELAWVRPHAVPGSGDKLRLPAPAGWLCWIDADTVAVSPQRAAHRVELWSLRERKPIRSFGQEREIALAPAGATRVREVQLRYDPARRLLLTLESFTGDLEAYSLEAGRGRPPADKPVWTARLADPYRKLEERILLDLDDRAKSREVSVGRAFSDLWLAAGPDGSAWVAQTVDVLHESVTLVKATAAGTRVEQVGNLRCPSRTFTIWGGQLIFFRDIASPREVCTSVAPLPSL